MISYLEGWPGFSSLTLNIFSVWSHSLFGIGLIGFLKYWIIGAMLTPQTWRKEKIEEDSL